MIYRKEKRPGSVSKSKSISLTVIYIVIEFVLSGYSIVLYWADQFVGLSLFNINTKLIQYWLMPGPDSLFSSDCFALFLFYFPVKGVLAVF